MKITVIFVPKLCKMVRHKLISCNFELRITYTLLQNYTAARCFCMGATLWRSFLFSDCESALLYLVFIKYAISMNDAKWLQIITLFSQASRLFSRNKHIFISKERKLSFSSYTSSISVQQSMQNKVFRNIF